MGRPGPATFAKRKREMEKKEKNQAKRELRAARRAEKALHPRQAVDGQDPDLVGIRPGPQPPRVD